MKSKKKLLKISGLIILLIISIVGLFCLNSYLKEERLFIYAKGINKKAFLNANWKMSIKEVERANGCQLSDGYDFSEFEPDLKFLLNRNRIQWKRSCKINIWGENREVYYDFFDDQLFRIRILDDVFDKREIDSMIVLSMEQKYGKKSGNIENKFAGKFSTNEVEIVYEQFGYDNKENKKVQRFRIEISYKPLLDEIKSISKKEQNNIF